MKLLLLHGLASKVSRQKLTDIKGKYKTDNILVFESGADPQTLLGNLMTGSLLESEQLFILENPPEDFVNYSLNDDQNMLILWFDHQISEKKPILEWVKKSKGEILFFPESKEVSIFPFLDYLATGDKKAYLEFNKSNFDIHYAITMVFYLLRNLMVTPKNAPTFVKQKLERQRKIFDQKRIEGLYKKVLEVDFKIKSGLLEIEQAKFLLVNYFLTN